ncbi:MAG: rhomboid family intramembrane serine protease [Acidobacteria bacterium]|nr:rhomboid family intramembrane serine protease [Acidobacteriota bacterium]
MSLKYQQDTDEAADAAAIRPVTPQPWASIALIACYTVVFIVQMTTGLEHSIIAAGDDKDAFIQHHEYWRLLTGAALHGGLLHYGFNTYAFYSFGRICEVLTNRWHIPVIFLLSAIAGGVLSFIVNPHGISVGASGGIIGLVGYLVVYSFKRREFINSEFRNSLIFNIGFILFYGFLLSQAVDNFAHIGGLLAGAVYALFQVPRDRYTDPRNASGLVEAFGLLSLAIYGAVCVFASLLIFRIV